MNDDRLNALLEAERMRPGFSRTERARLWNAVAGAVAAVPPPSAEPSGESSPAETSPHVPRGVRSIAISKAALAVAAAVVAGVGLGAAGHARFAEPRIVTVTQRIVEPALAPPTTTPASTQPAPAPAPSASGSVRPPSAASARALRPSEVPRGDANLARERVLLDMARTALTRSDPAGALAALNTHAREYPASQLAEEREVMAIQALVAGERLAEARARAASFRAKFPNSALRSIVDESVQ